MFFVFLHRKSSKTTVKTSYMATITMNGIWEILQTFSLTTKNKEWLAQRLINDIRAEQKTATARRAATELYSDLQGALAEIEEIKSGHRKAMTWEEMMHEL